MSERDVVDVARQAVATAAGTPPPVCAHLCRDNVPVRIATDGACAGNPGPGGWAWTTGEVAAAGAVPETTNNRMELLAVGAALLAFPGQCRIEVVTDSRYTIDALTTWVAGWRRRGWVNAKGRQVANRDLVEPIADLVDHKNVRWTWVRGHDGHELNEAADRLAVDGADHAKGGTHGLTTWPPTS